MTAESIARLKITLNNVQPQVWRRLEAPLTIRLDQPRLALQAAMGWTNAHLYEIRAGGVRSGEPDPEWDDDLLDASKTGLADALNEIGAKTFLYLYDFGDDWEHRIKTEHSFDAEPGVQYPRLTDAVGRRPPEDCGGPWAYPELLAAIAKRLARNPPKKRISAT